MNKISNHEFLQHAIRIHETKDVLEIFHSNLEKLQKSIVRRHRIDTKNNLPNEVVYVNLLHQIKTHINSTKIKFIDLYGSYINCINDRGYSATLILSRSILENLAMLCYLSNKLSEQLKKKKYIKLVEILLNYSVDHWNKDKIDEYKRIHINDALRFFSSTFLKNDGSSGIFDFYDPISEISHPSPTSFLMYSNIEHDGTKMTVNLSQYDINKYMITMSAFCLFGPEHLMNYIYPWVEKELVHSLEDSKKEIDEHFAYNPIDLDNFIKMVTPVSNKTDKINRKDFLNKKE